MAEHAAVLAALECVAAAEGTTSTDLLRRATRELLRSRSGDQNLREMLRKVMQSHAPKAPKRFQSAAQLSRYKERLREYDTLRLELGLVDASDVQQRNSIHAIHGRPVLVGSL